MPMRTLLFRLVLSGSLAPALLAPGRPLLGAEPGAPRADALGDALPAAALARFGTARFRCYPDTRVAALSPDGKLLALATPWSIRLLDTANGKEVRRIEGDAARGRGVGNLKFSPDGKLLAVVTHGSLDVFDVAKGASDAHPTHTRSQSPAARPEGRYTR
jgi:hypothetical protein